MRDKMGPNLGISSPIPRMKHIRTVRRMHRLKQNPVGMRKKELKVFEHELRGRLMASDSLLNVFVVFTLMTSPSGKLTSFVSLSNVKELKIRIELGLVLVGCFFK